MLMQEQKSAVEDPGRALNLGVGLASPLWPTFLATAGAGVAYWWWTQWAQIQDRSFAPLAAARPFLKLVEAPVPAPAVEPVLEAPTETTKAVSETVQETAAAAETAVEQAADTVVEQTTEVAAAVAPVPEEAVEAVSTAVEETVDAVQAAAPAAVEPIEAVAEAVTPAAPRKRPVAAKSGSVRASVKPSAAVRASAPKPPSGAGKRTRTPE